MAFLDLEQMRSVDWATGIYWDIRFVNAPAPFDQWFPAVDVEENIATLSNHTYEFYMSSFEFPLTSAIFDLQITFIDDVKHTVHEWIADWINNQILNNDKANGPYLSSLRESVQHVEVVRLDADKKVLRSSAYWVTPEGSLNWQGASAPDPSTNTMRFPIHGSARVSVEAA